MLPLLSAPTLKVTRTVCVTPAAVTLRSPRYVFAERPDGFAYRVKVAGTPASTAPTELESDKPDPVTLADNAPAAALVTLMVCATVEPEKEALNEIGLGETVRPAAVPPFTVRVTSMYAMEPSDAFNCTAPV